MRRILGPLIVLMFAARVHPETVSTTRTCFLALEVPPGTTEALAVLQAELGRAAPGLTWTEPAGFHVTMRFLGEQTEERLEALSQSLAAVARSTPPVALEARGLGTFPFRGRAKQGGGKPDARVLWAGVGGDRPELKALARRIEAAVQAAGHSPADYPFRPHLTLARAPRRGAMRPLRRVIQDLKGAEFGPLVGSGFTLFVVEPGGGYLPLRRFPLGEAGAPDGG